jgi:hypothetical protein
MELMGAIQGLRALKRQSEVEMMTDSDYVRRGMTNFLAGWKSRNWLNSTGMVVANRDLWEELDELCQYHVVTWTHVAGHCGHRDQERADKLATEAPVERSRMRRVLEPPSWLLAFFGEEAGNAASLYIRIRPLLCNGGGWAVSPNCKRNPKQQTKTDSSSSGCSAG